MSSIFRRSSTVLVLLVMAGLASCGTETTGPEGNQSRDVPVFVNHLVDLSKVSLIVPTGSISDVVGGGGLAGEWYLTSHAPACYPGNGSFVFIRLTSPTTADAIVAAGDCPASFPAGEARSYER